MAKQIVSWGHSAVDAVVKRFFEKVGIDPNYVIDYSVTRAIDDAGTITIKMHFDDEPAPAGDQE